MSHIVLEHFHGAASRVPVESTACTMRTTGFNVVIISQWTSAGETERGIAWARDTSWRADAVSGADALRELPRGRRRRFRGGRVRPELSAALRELKTKYDPDNVFRHNVNILPRSGKREGGSAGG